MTMIRFIRPHGQAGAGGSGDGESGQSLVEAALSISLLIAVVVGAAEIARVGYAAIEVGNAARAGAQYGAQSGYTAADTTGIATAASRDAGNLTTLTTSSCVESSPRWASARRTASRARPFCCRASLCSARLSVFTLASAFM